MCSGPLTKGALRRVSGDERSGLVVDEKGFVLAWFGLLLVVLIGVGGLAVDIGYWYYTASRMQKAADSAALAGAVYMPGPLPGPASATADELVIQNGFTAAETTVAQGTNPAQLKVTVDRTIDNFFIRVLGIKTQRLIRSAVAEYSGPIPMGSPANNLGNEPIPPGGGSVWGKTLTPPPGQFWINVAGPQATKISGDRHQARECGSSVHGCSGSGNSEYDARGYAFKVRVKSFTPGQRLAVEVFDPMFVQNGDTCTDGNISSATPHNSTLYASGPSSPYCTGDHNVNGPATQLRTTFVMRAPDLTPADGYDNPIINTGSCVPRVFGAFAGSGSGSPLGPQVSDPSTDVHKHWRKWSRVCELPLAGGYGAGDYILQITTGQEWNGSALVSRSVGTGHNRMALRAALVNTSGAIDNSSIELFADGRLPIYANASGADTRFYLARVVPGSDGRRLRVEFYDTGDASQPGAISVLPPPDATVGGAPIAGFSNCSYTAPVGSGILGSCTLSPVSSANYNGRVAVVTVPIPNGYNCNSSSPQGCWVRVRFTYPSGTNVNDTTTWTAKLEGDPVRLVE